MLVGPASSVVDDVRGGVSPEEPEKPPDPAHAPREEVLRPVQEVPRREKKVLDPVGEGFKTKEPPPESLLRGLRGSVGLEGPLLVYQLQEGLDVVGVAPQEEERLVERLEEFTGVPEIPKVLLQV